MELPTGDAFLEPLAARMRSGETDEALIDRAVLRVLAQKEELGLLDETFDEPPTVDRPRHPRAPRVALRLAEESLVLLTNDGVLPLERPRPRGSPCSARTPMRPKR